MKVAVGNYKRGRERTELQFLLAKLDHALTGKRWKDCFHTARNQHVDFDSLTSGGDCAYYLSDGGYSRLVVSSQDYRLFLTSNSRKQVKDRWDKCAAERKAVDDHVRALAYMAGWDGEQD
jgi:hypothetical protein